MSKEYQVYGVIRILASRSAPQNHNTRPSSTPLRERQELSVHPLLAKQITIGRALTNDIIVMDPAVSREQVRLVLDDQGWHIVNRATLPIQVNGYSVPGGRSYPLHSEDYIKLGNTILQLLIQPVPQGKERDWSQHPLQALYQAVISHHVTRRQKQGVSGNQEQKEARKAEVSQVEPVYQTNQPWTPEREPLLDAGVTLNFALPPAVQRSVRWLIAGIAGGILLLLILGTLVLTSLTGIASVITSGTPTLLQAFLLSLIPALGIGLLVNALDRYEREPWFLCVATFLWGALIAIPAALVIESKLGQALAALPGTNLLASASLQAGNAAFTEETVKGIGLLLLFLVLRDEFDNVTDGIVYGALIGASFAMVENVLYFTFYAKGYLLSLIVGRLLLGWLSHSTFTVCLGIALGLIRHERSRWRQISIPLCGYLCAVGLHLVFDFITFYVNGLLITYPGNGNISLLALLAVVGNYIPPFLAQVIILYVLIEALAQERAILREFLVSEMRSGSVLAEEYVLLQQSSQRIQVERQILFQQGIQQWLHIKALYQLQIGLAFRKWHVAMGDKPKAGKIQPEEIYRRRIKRLRQKIMQSEQRNK